MPQLLNNRKSHSNPRALESESSRVTGRLRRAVCVCGSNW